MDCKERVLTTFNHEEPDRVPIYVSAIDSNDVIDGFSEKKAKKKRKKIVSVSVKKSIKLIQRIGVDLHTIPVCLFPIGKSAGIGVKKPWLKTPPMSNYSDEYGRVFHIYTSPDSDLTLLNYVGGMFDSETGNVDEIIEKYDKWAPLDPNLKERWNWYEDALKYTKEVGPYIVPGIGGFLEVNWESFGFEAYAKLLFGRPDFIERVTKNNEEFNKALVEILSDHYNIELLMVYDDYGYKTGPFMSPRQFDKLIFPRLKDLVNFSAKKGIKIILHSCGNLNTLLDKIIETGIDGLNPIEPAASMDIFQLKEKYGKKITLLGNVDTAHLLPKGQPKEIEEYVKKEIKYCAPEGGLVMASGHSINPSISYVNYKTMIDTTKKYGNYPIKIDNLN